MENVINFKGVQKWANAAKDHKYHTELQFNIF